MSKCVNIIQKWSLKCKKKKGLLITTNLTTYLLL